MVSKLIQFHSRSVPVTTLNGRGGNQIDCGVPKCGCEGSGVSGWRQRVVRRSYLPKVQSQAVNLSLGLIQVQAVPLTYVALLRFQGTACYFYVSHRVISPVREHRYGMLEHFRTTSIAAMDFENRLIALARLNSSCRA